VAASAAAAASLCVDRLTGAVVKPGDPREVCTAKREVTATPLQSLVLLNDPQFVEAARRLAEHVLKRFPHDEVTRNREAFRSLIGRLPDDAEAGILARLFGEQRDLFGRNPSDAAKLLGVGESRWDAALPRADVAAMTTVVNAIMNFDEFVVIR
jgi:DNA-directed RNA polymerase specialized sigma24 family protein